MSGVDAGIVCLQWRRPSLALVEVDTPEFTRALEAWAEAAFLAHKDRRGLEAFRDRRIGLEALTGTSRNDQDAFAEAVQRAMAALRSDGLPFQPSPEDARAFLDAWTAVTVRA